MCSLVAVSCEVEFDFKDLDGDPLFLIDGNIEYGDGWSENSSATQQPSKNTYLQMYLYAVPSAAGDREFDENARCTLKVYKNSELIDTQDYITIEPFFGLIVGNYPGIVPGDEIMITAESEGFPTASARTVIPQDPPAVEVSVTPVDKSLKISFSIEDDASSEDAYAFCFLVAEGKPDYIGDDLILSAGNSAATSILDSGPFDVTWEDSYRYYGISDDTFSGGRKEFEVYAPYEFPPNNNPVYFHMEVQRISPERLRYETACNDKGSNILGFIGLAPVTFAYTNVSGGSGCLSSSNPTFTEWIEIPRPEN